MSHYRAQHLSWKQQGSLRGSNRGYMLIFVWRSLEGNNTAEKERGTELQTGRLPRAEIMNFLPKKPEWTQQGALEAIPYLLQLTNLVSCHGKAAIGNKHTRLCPSKALFVETGSRFGLQVLVCRLQSKIALFKGTFCSNEMLHRCSTQFCRHTGLWSTGNVTSHAEELNF